jgi:hypothetical protein
MNKTKTTLSIVLLLAVVLSSLMLQHIWLEKEKISPLSGCRWQIKTGGTLCLSMGMHHTPPGYI